MGIKEKNGFFNDSEKPKISLSQIGFFDQSKKSDYFIHFSPIRTKPFITQGSDGTLNPPYQPQCCFNNTSGG
jgi:hypothetical protein